MNWWRVHGRRATLERSWELTVNIFSLPHGSTNIESQGRSPMTDPDNIPPGELSGAQAGTVRQRITHLLEQEELTARDISQRIGIREKEVYDHLAHISRTMTARGKKLRVPPFACLSCGYIFKERERFTRPGRCPSCRGTRIQTPVYKLT